MLVKNVTIYNLDTNLNRSKKHGRVTVVFGNHRGQPRGRAMRELHPGWNAS